LRFGSFRSVDGPWGPIEGYGQMHAIRKRQVGLGREKALPSYPWSLSDYLVG
jgi:hypothetical protein